MERRLCNMTFQFDSEGSCTEEAMAKILLVTGDGAESLEVMYPYQRLTEEGYQVDIASPTKKTLHTVVHDFEPGWETNTEKLGYQIHPDITFAEVKPDDYVGLVIPGGGRRNTSVMIKTCRGLSKRSSPPTSRWRHSAMRARFLLPGSWSRAAP